MNEKKNIIKKMNVFRIIFVILFIGVLCVIFNFSSQDADESRNLSRKFTESLVSNIEEIQEKPETEREKIVRDL